MNYLLKNLYYILICNCNLMIFYQKQGYIYKTIEEKMYKKSYYGKLNCGKIGILNNTVKK